MVERKREREREREGKLKREPSWRRSLSHRVSVSPVLSPSLNSRWAHDLLIGHDNADRADNIHRPSRFQRFERKRKGRKKGRDVSGSAASGSIAQRLKEFNNERLEMEKQVGSRYSVSW
ncbi:hypothetical protein NE237_007941 [Protea cynaroides]|uniref:Uncharacterized protein n=1 Tax=Protea cynaroides TaxID=273540 RepID=A0A9Q0KQ45_9MAGN|nr:hypothetical protein NE237_007941 [Protea cynaroides]